MALGIYVALLGIRSLYKELGRRNLGQKPKPLYVGRASRDLGIFKGTGYFYAGIAVIPRGG